MDSTRTPGLVLSDPAEGEEASELEGILTDTDVVRKVLAVGVSSLAKLHAKAAGSSALSTTARSSSTTTSASGALTPFHRGPPPPPPPPPKVQIGVITSKAPLIVRAGFELSSERVGSP